MEVLPTRGTAEVATGQPAGEGDEEPQPHGRTSRTASLVSGLLTELYSCTEEEEGAAGGDRAARGRSLRSDSLDSSTETSGSDVFLGSRGAGDSRVLQELRERRSLRLQMQYLRRKGEHGDPRLPAPPALLGHLPTWATCPTHPPASFAPPAHLRQLPTSPSAPPGRRRPAAHRESVESPVL